MHKNSAQFILHAFWYICENASKCISMHQNASVCIKMHQVHQNASNVCRMNCANVLWTNLLKKWFLLHLIRVKCINMHLNASKCIIMYAEWIILKFCAWNFNLKNSIFLVKIDKFFSKFLKCINMHQNASKCMQNELCKCFVHEIINAVFFITF